MGDLASSCKLFQQGCNILVHLGDVIANLWKVEIQVGQFSANPHGGSVGVNMADLGNDLEEQWPIGRPIHCVVIATE